jgi:DnaJ domain
MMKTNSTLFDQIRVKPGADRRVRNQSPGCEWPGCKEPGTHRAPKGRANANEYWQLCLDHVREYNSSYNFFAGMSDEAIARYQKDDLTGHRPTWKLGSVGGKRAARRGKAEFRGADWVTNDPFSLFGETSKPGHARTAPEARKVLNAQRRALDALGLEGDASRADIKTRFKRLVKQHHPDVNGGDRSSEERLREIIQAYNYLKTAGFC